MALVRRVMVRLGDKVGAEGRAGVVWVVGRCGICVVILGWFSCGLGCALLNKSLSRGRYRSGNSSLRLEAMVRVFSGRL